MQFSTPRVVYGPRSNVDIGSAFMFCSANIIIVCDELFLFIIVSVINGHIACRWHMIESLPKEDVSISITFWYKVHVYTCECSNKIVHI